MVDVSRPYRRLVLVADMVRYSARSSVRQHEAQTVFREALDAAGAAAGLDRGTWRRQSSGDGECAVLPADVDEPALLSGFLVALDRYLRGYNSRLRTDAMVRVRVAVHQGLIFPDSANGYAGEAVNTAARLVDAPVLKAAFDAFPEAAVACIVSEGIHRDVVAGGFEGIRPERFRRVRVSLPQKGFDEWAWLEIVDENVIDLDLPGEETVPAGGPGSSGGPSAAAARPDLRGDPAPGGIRVGDVSNRDGQIAIGHGAAAVGGRARGNRFEQ